MSYFFLAIFIILGSSLKIKALYRAFYFTFRHADAGTLSHKVL